MIDTESIKRASDLVNSILFAKGFFEGGSGLNDQLLFKSINQKELDTEEQVYDNDKLVINTIYALIQNYDKSKQERTFLLDQLNDKKEIINHYEASSRELNAKNEVLTRINQRQQNEINSLKQQLKSMRNEKHIEEKNLLHERYLNSSIKTKFEIEIKKKTIMINQLQDKLLNRNKKYQSIIEGNNPSFTAISSIPNDTGPIMDQELEKMLVDLSNLITNLTIQNDQNIKFINFLTNYLTILNDFMTRKSNFGDENGSVSLPPTPKFYYEKFQSLNQDIQPIGGIDNDITTKISHIKDFQQIQSGVFSNLDKFYESMINENYTIGSSSSGLSNGGDERVKQLEKQVMELNSSLSIAIETNENWKKKFQTLEKQNR